MTGGLINAPPRWVRHFALDTAFDDVTLDDESLPAVASRVHAHGGDVRRFRASLAAGASVPGFGDIVDRDRIAVAAWRSGVPGFRRDALARMDRVITGNPSAEKAFAAMIHPGVDFQLTDFLSGQRADPFHWERPLAIVGRVGGYRGLGGSFAAGPNALAADPRPGMAQVRCGRDLWALRADIFGATLIALDEDLASGDGAQQSWESAVALSPSVTVGVDQRSYLVWLRQEQK